jgi:hypothetical protein
MRKVLLFLVVVAGLFAEEKFVIGPTPGEGFFSSFLGVLNDTPNRNLRPLGRS